MLERCSFLLLLAAAVPCSAQLQDGISTSVYRTVRVTPNEARFEIRVNAPATATLAQVLQRLSSVGVQPSDLVGETVQPGISFVDQSPQPVNPPVQRVPTVTMSFAVVRPADQFRTVSQQLSALQTPQGGISVTFSAGLVANEVAVEEMRRAQLQHLLVEARRKAESIASASGLNLGALQSVADGAPAGVIGAVIGPGFSSVGSDFRVTYAVTVRYAVK